MTKNHNCILIVIFINTLISCQHEPKVRFFEPQPLNKRYLKSFPENYQGKYLGKSDSAILTINSKTIYKEWNGFAKVSNFYMKEELDTTYKYDTKIKLGENWTMIVDVDEDSTNIKTYRIDTLFNISENNKLKNYKGFMFLNNKRTDSTWSVKILKLVKGQLNFDKLIDYTQIDTLKGITKVLTQIDTASNVVDFYYLNPEKKELKELLKRKQPDSKYRKIK